jgi:hypothetical protein
MDQTNRQNTKKIDDFIRSQFDLVVDETDICLFDPFLFVLLLFRLQRQLDEEDLLQLLIHVVDAELSEAVLVEDLKVVDV